MDLQFLKPRRVYHRINVVRYSVHFAGGKQYRCDVPITSREIVINNLSKLDPNLVDYVVVSGHYIYDIANSDWEYVVNTAIENRHDWRAERDSFLQSSPEVV